MDEPRSRLRHGARAALPIVPATFAFGVAFGVLARAAHFDAVAAIVFSATTFAGSAQFAAVSVLGAGGGLSAAIGAAILLNTRYAPIGISVGSIFRGSLVRRLVEAQLIVDESWAVAGRGARGFDRRLLLGAGLILWVGWTAGTAIGAVAGNALGDPGRLGLDGAFGALFLALLAPQLRTRRSAAAALLGAAIALALVPLTPAGVPIVAASAACLAGWRR
jgi:4-azaleucine resistance transporter AzlC